MSAEYISKSEQKRRFKRIENAAVELSCLGDNELKTLIDNNAIDEEIKEEVRTCRTVKGAAKKRQIKYIAKLLREFDMVESVLDFLAVQKGSKLKENTLQHEAERLRDLLVNEALAHQQDAQQYQEKFTPDWQGEEVVHVAAELNLNEKEVRRLLYQYAQTRVHTHYREVFRIIKAALIIKEKN